jgi:hypothetical protein
VLRGVIDKKAANEEQLKTRFQAKEENPLKTSSIFEAMTRNLSDYDHIYDPMSFGIAVTSDDPNANLTFHSKFFVKGKSIIPDLHPSALWENFLKKGCLANVNQIAPSVPGEVIGAAVAATVRIPAGMCKRVVFSLAWDVPICRFNSGAGFVFSFLFFFFFFFKYLLFFYFFYFLIFNLIFILFFFIF